MKTKSKTAEFSYVVKPIRELPKGLPTMNDRIEFIRCTLGYPVNTFAIKVGASKASIKKVLAGTATPTMKLLLNILEIFPVSKEWLYIGNGQPWTKDDLSDYIYEVRSESNQGDVDMDVNARLREIRNDSGLSQPVFAAALGLTKDIVAFIETGRTGISIPTLKKILKKYNVSDQWMLWGVGNKYKVRK